MQQKFKKSTRKMKCRENDLCISAEFIYKLSENNKCFASICFDFTKRIVRFNIPPPCESKCIVMSVKNRAFLPFTVFFFFFLTVMLYVKTNMYIYEMYYCNHWIMYNTPFLFVCDKKKILNIDGQIANQWEHWCLRTWVSPPLPHTLI